MTMTDGPYQHCRPLTEEEYDALKADIAENGVLEYVHVDEEGEILVGHHRARAAIELGIEYPRHVVTGLSEQGKHEYAVRLESLGRAKDIDTKKYTAKSLWEDDRVKVNNTHLAELVGVNRDTMNKWVKVWRTEADERRRRVPSTSSEAEAAPARAPDALGRMQPTTRTVKQNGTDIVEAEDAEPVKEYQGRYVDPTRPEPKTMGEILGPNPEPFDDTGLKEEMAAQRRYKQAVAVQVDLLRLVQTYGPEVMVEGERPEDLSALERNLAMIIDWLTRARQLALNPRQQIRSVPR